MPIPTDPKTLSEMDLDSGVSCRKFVTEFSAVDRFGGDTRSEICYVPTSSKKVRKHFINLSAHTADTQSVEITQEKQKLYKSGRHSPISCSGASILDILRYANVEATQLHRLTPLMTIHRLALKTGLKSAAGGITIVETRDECMAK